MPREDRGWTAAAARQAREPGWLLTVLEEAEGGGEEIAAMFPEGGYGVQHARVCNVLEGKKDLCTTVRHTTNRVRVSLRDGAPCSRRPSTTPMRIV